MSVILLSSDLMLSSKVAGASQRSGVSVSTALSVAALVEKAETGRPKLVILDLTTPGLAPAELVPRLKALASAPAVIAFGPHVQDSLLEAATNAGCDQVLTRGQFHAAVDAMLQQYR